MSHSDDSQKDPSCRLAIFAKYWEPGQSKTRLARDIGEVASAQLSRCFLACLLNRLRSESDIRSLVFAPDHRLDDFRNFLREEVSAEPGTWQLELQGSGDLGERMERFLRRALARGATKVVLIGSDMPTLAKDRIDQAWNALNDRPVVLGPAEDGGYYLLGVRGDVPPIFSDIAWGTSQVLHQTEQRLNRHHIPYHLLPSGYDIDRIEDLRRLGEELARWPGEPDPAMTALRMGVQSALQTPDAPFRPKRESSSESPGRS